MKTCVRCTVEKDGSEFSRRSSAKDGLASYCKSCACGYHAEWFKKNKAKQAAQMLEYREARREQLAAYSRAYHAENTARVALTRKRYRHANPEMMRRHARLDAQRRRGVAMDATARDYFELVRLDPCSYCGGLGGEVDHIDAVTKDGTGDWMNLTGACRGCNAGKSTKPLLTALLQFAS